MIFRIPRQASISSTSIPISAASRWNVETTDGRAILLELVRKADVVIETFVAKHADKVGLSYAQLSAINSRLVVASITPFGRSGPWRDYKADDIAGIALGNLLYLAGERGKSPLQPAGELAYAHRIGLWRLWRCGGALSPSGKWTRPAYRRVDPRMRGAHRRVLHSPLQCHGGETSAREAAAISRPASLLGEHNNEISRCRVDDRSGRADGRARAVRVRRRSHPLRDAVARRWSSGRGPEVVEQEAGFHKTPARQEVLHSHSPLGDWGKYAGSLAHGATYL